MVVEYNISRLDYLLKLYRLSIDDLLKIISEGLVNPIIKNDIYSKEIKLSYLKKIDKVFNKGLEFYLNPKPIEIRKDSSIFFRKDVFNSELNLGSKRIVSEFEDLKISLSSLSKLSDIKFQRILPIYKVSQNPREIAYSVRESLYPIMFSNVLRDFLKSLISRFSEQNIFVFEFVETWNKKEKANINGFYLEPNVIVLKRQQKSFRREIFTLIHELGHYLLNIEEIEEVDVKSISDNRLNQVENWCNEFSYYFLIGERGETMDELGLANSSNDYHHDEIEMISKETNLSVLALYTRLLFTNKISNRNYTNVKNELEELYQRKVEEENRKKELTKLEEGNKKKSGSTPKPINSPLFISVLQTALFDGVINEYDFCKKLRIKPEKIDNYIQ